LPEFETDENRTYLIITIKMRSGFEYRKKDSDQKNERSLSEVLSKKDYDKVLSPATVRRYLGILVDAGVIEPEGSTNNIVYARRG